MRCRPDGADASAAAPSGAGEPAGPVKPGAGAAAAAASMPSGPCASRVTSGGDDGASAASWRSAVKMSSGRTAGVKCRTTIRSIAHAASRPTSACPPACIVTTAARASTGRVPLLVRRSTTTVRAARNVSTARSASAGATPGRTTCHSDASRRSASSRPAGGPAPAAWPATADSAAADCAAADCATADKAAADKAAADKAAARGAAGSPDAPACPASGALVNSKTSITSIPLGRAASSRSRTSEAAHCPVRASSRYSASLAVPVCAPPA